MPVTTAEQAIDAIAGGGVSETEALRGWYLARQAATRYNRNLLQYGAGLAAVIGINAGTGGMLALADSLALRTAVASGETVTNPAQRPMWEFSSPAAWMVVLTSVAAVVLLLLLVRSYRDRQRAERSAEAHAERLIAVNPQWFRPGPE
jgi:hypothetical protein